MEIIEDSPYKFLNTQPPKNIQSLQKLKEDSEIHSTFKEVYKQFLIQFTDKSEERTILKQMTSKALYQEIDEYLRESVELNSGTLIVENEDTNLFEISIESAKFRCGLHCDA